MVKAIGVVGSPRKQGNTEILTEHILRAIAEEGLGTELIRLAGLDIRPCTACIRWKGRWAARCSPEHASYEMAIKQ